ncbi:hypothetical protein JR316_0006139 [Psilocybe cubensis]|uniref:Uncharacterized protein n=1 Tax=Psilocybe cubensis TaxID=181762 RepID=A0ACB8H1P4_PSICU|nr:hypothetical protein JR316_0006139 [Psilocybe cubensis]KAH9481612.1 hypothetical protein JR316_0006139 [Psilocybe cubensis]
MDDALAFLKVLNRSTILGKTPLSPNFGPSSNLDGSLRDQDTFILGDDDDEDDVLTTYDGGIRVRDSGAPPPYTSICEHPSGAVAPPQTSHVQHPSDSTNPDPNASPNSRMVTMSANSTKATPYKYYLDRKDTLQGLSLRFGIDGHEICRMNKLPPSVLRTTPHLLHTRSFLLLPPSAKPHPSLTLSTAEEEALEAKLVRERAEKKLQTLTKEADWRIAKAYVALADDCQVQEDFSSKRKEMGFAKGNVQTASASKLDGLEALAAAHYLDDEEWEAEERRAGRDVQVLRLPAPDSNQAQATNGQWWGRRKS